MANNETEKVLDHNYDGIQELDNPLPRWWVYLFYLTVAFGCVYFVYYIFGYGPSLNETFQEDMALIQKANVSTDSETLTVEFDRSPEMLDRGQGLFEGKCAPCHGQKAEGLVGPNLTDNEWLNSTGSDIDIFTVITNGVPEKGMISWKDLLSDKDRVALTVFIQSIKGSND